MSTKKVTDHHDGNDHTRRIEKTNSDGSKHIVEQKVKDSFMGEVYAKNTSVTRVDRDGNSSTKKSK